MIDISSDAYWYWDGSDFNYNTNDKSGVITDGWFPNYGQYNPHFGSGSVTSILKYIGESLIGKTIFISTVNIGIVVYYNYNRNENSGWWGENEGFDADFIQTNDGVASIFLTKDVYGIGVLIRGEGYVGDWAVEPIVIISSIQLSDSSKWTNFRNTVELTA